MNQVTRNIISFILAALIVMINLVELAVTVNHFQNHDIVDTSSIKLNHNDYESHGSHISNAHNHDVCTGHYLNFMPQIDVDVRAFEIKTPNQLSFGQPLFLSVMQYSSSYTHLFTSRPPPSFI